MPATFLGAKEGGSLVDRARAAVAGLPMCTVAFDIAVMAAFAAFYGFYLKWGVHFIADAGNYAQLVYEMFLGRDVNDMDFHYGVSWFKLGEVLFHLFGVNYVLVKLVFLTAIFITSLLTYYTCLRITRSRLLAAILAAVPAPAVIAAIPALYGLCVMLNVAAQMRLADGLRSDAHYRWGAALTGAALSLTFQLRPDFGYVFAVSLAGVLILVTRPGSSREVAVPPLATLILWAAAGFLVLQLPIFLDALWRGYFPLLFERYFEYLRIMADYSFGGIRRVFAERPADAAHVTDTVLQRPGLAALLSKDRHTAEIALFVYLPTVGLSAFAALNAWTLPRRLKERRWNDLAQSFVALAAAAPFPHYFIFRPDTAHVANFMLGYMALAAVFLRQLYVAARAAPRGRLRAAAGVGGVLVACHLAHYFWIGLTSDFFGSMAVATSRSAVVQAGDRVDIRVTEDEKRTLDLVRETVEANSKPGDAIVCLPYCPGMAFLTARRMFFREYYVDDGTPTHDPTWVARAIDATREKRPPVVIVMDWDLNGTDSSRFAHWAAPYIDVVESLAREKIVRGSVTIYLL